MKQKIRLIFKWIFKLAIALTVFFSVVAVPFLIAAEAWTPLKYISLFVALAIFIQIHKLVIKKKSFEWYRWLVNSLIYRWNVLILKWMFRRLAFNEKVKFHLLSVSKDESNSRWYDKYWFGRGIKRVIMNEMLKAHVLENEK